ncbi:X-Pro dipeptidyl-peptidase protein [Fusarium redolens]|uniref:X-Pro dipeptidyl-peptidase protein n=1 Tax=Fusarium redolens TaxID=48865 RepID=A0A9P9G163_FUSRE|nr:X-Pro dipeptidyl-peptidase protein [Fusarium redolens]KAH7230210.1 X-Pro dipeptidyl-peptidase protein [Fusarium redolens]
MPPFLGDISTVDTASYPYIFEKNVTVVTKSGTAIRCNVYRPKTTDQDAKFPVLATCGPYGKDVHYSHFNANSYAEVNPAHKTEHSAWEVPTPRHWTERGYVVIRADEAGTGQSPGFLDIWSASTTQSFCDLIEWASEQPWSNGRVGLLGISYYGSTQWRVAAQRPKGLAAIVPWEGFSDLYRDACRHGGILSNAGFNKIWDRQIGPTQYGLPGRATRNWGDDTIEGDMSEEGLSRNRVTLVDAARANPFRDCSRFASVDYNLEDIRVPVLSVANWGGISLHLRGNVQGFMHAGSEFKYLRFIVGRHDLPFFYPEEVEIQQSFLDAFLKDDDRAGWTMKGKIPPVDLILRKGNVGYNNPKAESQFLRRKEKEWPIARTLYKSMFLGPDGTLSWERPTDHRSQKISYQALGSGNLQHSVSFRSAPFESETEITGHIVAHLNVSVSPDTPEAYPSEIDLFLSLRHIAASGDEIFYTGTTGEPAPVAKGFLRVSMRKTNPQHPWHKPWLPYRDYFSTDVLPVAPGEVYEVDVEIWPTNVVVQKGESLALDIGSGDLAGSGLFLHNDPIDRPEETLRGLNSIHFREVYNNYIILPVIPSNS